VDVGAVVDRGVTERVEEIALAGAGRVEDDEVLVGRSTPTSPTIARSGRVEDAVSSQVSRVLPVGNPAAARRVLIDDAMRPASSPRAPF
jgi:hypothetical protein